MSKEEMNERYMATANGGPGGVPEGGEGEVTIEDIAEVLNELVSEGTIDSATAESAMEDILAAALGEGGGVPGAELAEGAESPAPDTIEDVAAAPAPKSDVDPKMASVKKNLKARVKKALSQKG